MSSTPPRPSPLPPERVGPYQLVTELGLGPLGPLSGGRVASGSEEGRLVAVRRISIAACGPDEVKRLLEAAEIARSVRRSKLAAVLDVVATDREIAVIGEYVDGPMLSSLQRLAYAKRSPLPPAVALRIGVEILQGLRAARDAWKVVAPPALREAIHGSISPDTVFVAANGDVLLGEIGFSAVSATLGPFRWLPGLLSYRSPEELSGNVERSVDERSDIFSLGVILWELLANRPLFGDPERFSGPRSESIHAALVARTQRDIQSMPIPSLGAKEGGRAPIARAAIEVVERALRHDPATRFSGIDQMLGALNHLDRDVVASADQVGLALSELARVEIEAQRTVMGSSSSVRPRPSSRPPRDSSRPMPRPQTSASPGPAPTPPTAAKAQSTPPPPRKPSESPAAPPARRLPKLPPMRKLPLSTVPPPPARPARPSSIPPVARPMTIPPPPARPSSTPPPPGAQTARPTSGPPPRPARAVRPASTPPPPPVRKARPTSTPPTAPVAEPPTSPADPAPADPTPAATVIAAPAISADLLPLPEVPEAVLHAPEVNLPASDAPTELGRTVDAAPGVLAVPQLRTRRIALVIGGVVSLIALLGLLRALLRPASDTAEASMPQATQSVAPPPPVAEKTPVPKPVAQVPPAATAASLDERDVAPQPPREAPAQAAPKVLPYAPQRARPPAPPPRNDQSGFQEPSEPPRKPFRPKGI